MGIYLSITTKGVRLSLLASPTLNGPTNISLGLTHTAVETLVTIITSLDVVSMHSLDTEVGANQRRYWVIDFDIVVKSLNNEFQFYIAHNGVIDHDSKVVFAKI
jgi:hypothetical protein